MGFRSTEPKERDDADGNDVVLAAVLPDLALLVVFKYVAADNLDDLVSAGQVCRHWRRVAASENLWRHRSLKCHSMATQAFTRVMAFAPCLLALDVCWINQISPEDRVIRKQVLLESECQLSRLTGVMCHRDSAWTEKLLARQAAHLRELEVSTADRSALEAIDGMPRLRALHISSGDLSLVVNPYLYSPHSAKRKKVGLQKLEVRGLPRETTFSLLEAHKQTLKKLTLNVGTPKEDASPPLWPKTCNDLPQVLHSCGLKLQELTLTRYVNCCHTAQECVQQRRDLALRLSPVQVQCSDCSP